MYVRCIFLNIADTLAQFQFNGNIQTYGLS